MKRPEEEAAETGRLSEALGPIIEALEAFSRYEGPDPAGKAREIWKKVLERPLPEQGAGLDAVIRTLSESVIPYGLRNGAPGFCGWVTTSPTTAATAASLAGTVAGSQRFWIQPFNYLERLALTWLGDLLELDPGCQGTFSSGGSIANLIALGAARQHAFEKTGRDPSREGLPAGTRWRIYASSEVHHVVIRAAGVLGLGRESVASIPVDAAQRIDMKHLRAQLTKDRSDKILPVAIVASGGTVNTGAVDPIEEMAALAAEHETWLHVDGAYGLFSILDERVAPLFKGVETADSTAADPHKWLAVPVGCGATFVRDGDRLRRAFTLVRADYLEGSADETEINSTFDTMGEIFHDYNLEQSAPSRGVLVWAILHEIGREGMRRRVRRHNDYARLLASIVQDDPRLELLAEPVLSICCFRYRKEGLDPEALDDLNLRIMRRLRAEGIHVPSTTRVKGAFTIRACYINPRTRRDAVEDLAKTVGRIGDSIAEGE